MTHPTRDEGATDIRAVLDGHGLSLFDAVLPGDEIPPLDGALHVEASTSGWALTTVDYGQHWMLGEAPTKKGAEQLLVDYVARPLGAVIKSTAAELDQTMSDDAAHYLEILDRAIAAGSPGIVIDLPPGIALDRMGALDGINLYPLGTPFEQRSLPPVIGHTEMDVHEFTTAGTVRVGVVVTPPWFGRPGGGLRFTIQEPRVGIRDLVVAGVLRRIRRVG